MNLVSDSQRIPPVRGLVALQNAKGRAIRAVDRSRWLRLNCLVYGAQKVDLLADRESIASVPETLRECQAHQLAGSPRIHVDGPAVDLSEIAAAGAHDLYLTATHRNLDHLSEWIRSGHAVGLAMRVQLHGPLEHDMDALAERLAQPGVVVVNLAVVDSFAPGPPARNVQHAKVAIEAYRALLACLKGRGAEVNLIGLPFCQADETDWANIEMSAQFHADHQHYHAGSYDLAKSLIGLPSSVAGGILQILLSRATFERTFPDAVVLRLLLYSRLAYTAGLVWHKLTRRARVLRGLPRETESSLEAFARQRDRAERRKRRVLGKACSACSLQRICDGMTPELERALPGIEPRAIEGDHIVSPLHFAADQPKYYDTVDAARRVQGPEQEALTKAAQTALDGREPDRVVMPFEYDVEHAPFEHLEGGVRWHSLAAGEKLSSSLPTLDAPCTIQLGIGGGIADYVGFSFGRHCKLLCPMDAYRHTIALHVDEAGHYVLLRDGETIRPVALEGQVYAPTRLGTELTPRISLWNIDGSIVTQFVKIWNHSESRVRGEDLRYSFIIVNARYARRLQAALTSIAHQRDIDLSAVEVIVCYVPGLDATDDLIDSMQQTWPDLRIVRCPFAEAFAQRKGFMINEATELVSGAYTILMDADIVLPPTMISAMEALPDAPSFIAPDGRKMLSRETTARILMGEIAPWDSWQDLVDGAGEYRHREAEGVPVGFFQCVKSDILRDIKYAELDHFEGADMWFGMAVQEKYGKEVRLSGMPVLHLDHGGSQWYGTTKHF